MKSLGLAYAAPYNRLACAVGFLLSRFAAGVGETVPTFSCRSGSRHRLILSVQHCGQRGENARLSTGKLE